MSPFAEFLHELRMRHGIRQSELAKIMGYEQGYLSALELDKKGPPTEEFINKLINKFNLTSQETSQLLEVVDASQRKFAFSNEISKDAYWLIRDFRESLPALTKAEIELLRKVLAFKKDVLQKPLDVPRQLKRRKNEEAKM